jgi:hypothetical protein
MLFCSVPKHAPLRGFGPDGDDGRRPFRERYEQRYGRPIRTWAGGVDSHCTSPLPATVGAASGPQLGGTWGTTRDSRRQRTLRSPTVSQRSPGQRIAWTALSHGRDHDLLGSGDLVGGTDCLHPNDAGHPEDRRGVRGGAGRGGRPGRGIRPDDCRYWGGFRRDRAMEAPASRFAQHKNA